MDKLISFITPGYIDPGTGYTITTIGGWIVVFFIGFLGILWVLLKKFFKQIKNGYFKIAVIILLVLIAIIFIAKGAFMEEMPSRFDKKIVILGFDALSPEIMEPMMKEGLLPNFSKLKETGSYRRLSTTNPSQSPVAWAGFATGKNPGKSGVFDFIIRNPRNYTIHFPGTSLRDGKPERMLRAEGFWQYLSGKAVPATVICCPDTFPPDKIRGKMLSGMGVPDLLGTKGIFSYYTTENIAPAPTVGGMVHRVNKSSIMVMNLLGPRVAGFGGGAPHNVTVPFKAVVKDANTVTIEFQNHSIDLKAGEWSHWAEVRFDIDVFRKAKGIFKFYLESVGPEFRLYVTPINFDPRDPFFPISYPKDYSKKLVDSVGLYYTLGMPEDTWAVNEGRLSEEAFLEQTDEIFRKRKAMLDLELKNLRDGGVLFCYFEDPDIIQHMFWRYVDAESPSFAGRYKDVIYDSYKRMDTVLGDVLKGLGPDDTIIVLSDHGFAAFRRAVHINSWLRDNGYLVLNNSQTSSPEGRFSDIDWSRTKAYATGFGAIYINQEGRERSGIVNPGEATELLKKEIAQKLSKWVDGKNNRPVVRRVYKSEEIFHGKYAKEAPDLYIGFNDGYRASWQTATRGVPVHTIDDNLKKWAGDHLVDPDLVPGVLFSNKTIKKDKPSIYDITPTILKIAGYSDEELKKCDFDGAALL